jgi:hypothetical protein
MKKKVVSIILVIAMLAALFAGCDEIIKKNDRRDFEQHIMTVEYTSTINGQQSHQVGYIMKGEFALSFNSNAQTYAQYYGMTYFQAADYIMNSLARRELMVLFAKAYVIENGVDGLFTQKLPENCTTRELLTAAEVEKAIKNTNDDLKTALDSLIAGYIADEEKNKGVEPTEDVVEDSSKDAVTYKVIFDSDGGDYTPTTQIVGEGKRVAKPDDPVKDGYHFGYWVYKSGEKQGQKFDFKTDVITEKTTLKAIWHEYTIPRAKMPEEQAPEEKFDQFKPVAVLPPYFFSDEYLSRTNGFLTFEDEQYWDYLDDAVAQLKKNLDKTFRDYDYYLESEMKTVLLEKFERHVYASAESEQGYAEKVQVEYDRLVAQNKEKFAISDENYETALKSTLSQTLYHKYTDPVYGFTRNILLKFDKDDLKVLTDAVATGTSTTAQIKALRDSIAQNMMIKVSNPDYDPLEEEKNPYDPEDTTPDQNTEEDYNQIISFEYDDSEGWHIVYNVSEDANRGYLKTEWPAFSVDSKVGIVNQIYATLDSVVAARGPGENQLSYTESIYWLRKVTEAWLYLVGDDPGGTSSDDNNGGLGYLISAEGESGYIKEYETQARALIELGTGSYSIDGTLAGSYVVGDNFIDEKTTDSAYAGIFIIFISAVPYDTDFYTQSGGTGTMDNGLLPDDYILEIAKDQADNVTVYDKIYKSILESRKTEVYSILVNRFLNNKLEGKTGKMTLNQKVWDAFFKGAK